MRRAIPAQDAGSPAIGDDYIAKASSSPARRPDAELCYNEYGNEQPEKLREAVGLIRELKAAACDRQGRYAVPLPAR